MKHKLGLKNLLRPAPLLRGVIVLIIGALGVIALQMSQAATTDVAQEAESGTLSGNAVQVSAAEASGGKAVKFQIGGSTGQPGFITRQGTKLMLNGKQYKFAGVNADTWFGCWPNEIPTDDQLDRYFRELNPHSMTRIWPYPGSDLSIMDRIVAKAEQYQQYLAPVIMDGNADCGQPSPDFANPTYELSWIDQLVPRYKDSPAIGFWEIINEPDGDNGNLKSYYRTLSDHIRSLDSKHLIGSGAHAAWSGGEAKYTSDHDVPNLDLISMHEYDAATGVSSHGEASSRAARALDKPWYAGEDGFCCGGGDTGSQAGNAAKLKTEWQAYLDVPECAGMLYWDFKLGHADDSTLRFDAPMWDDAAKTFRHDYHAL